MLESGEPMEFGIFDFYKVFSRDFGEEGDVMNNPGIEFQGIKVMFVS